MPRSVGTLGDDHYATPRHTLYPHKVIISDRYYLRTGTSGEEGDALIQTRDADGNFIYKDEGDRRRYEVRACIGNASLLQTHVTGILISPKSETDAERNVSVMIHGSHKLTAGEDDIEKDDLLMAGLTGYQGQVVKLTGSGTTMKKSELGWALEPADSGEDFPAIIDVRGF